MQSIAGALQIDMKEVEIEVGKWLMLGRIFTAVVRFRELQTRG